MRRLLRFWLRFALALITIAAAAIRAKILVIGGWFFERQFWRPQLCAQSILDVQTIKTLNGLHVGSKQTAGESKVEKIFCEGLCL